MIYPYRRPDQPEPRQEEHREEQSAKVGHLEAQRPNTSRITQAHESHQHERTVGSCAVGKRGDNATHAPIGEKELTHPRAHTLAGGERDHEPENNVDADGQPCPCRATHSRHLRNSTNMLAIATAVHATQKRKAPVKRAYPPSTYQGIAMSSTRRAPSHAQTNLLFVIIPDYING